MSIISGKRISLLGVYKNKILHFHKVQHVLFYNVNSNHNENKKCNQRNKN